MSALAGVALAAAPFVLVWALLALAGHAQRRRAAALARQIELTDAIHARLGAAVAPVVRRRLGGRWQVRIPVPFERPALVESVARIAREVMVSRDGRAAEAWELVLSPRAPVLAAGGRAPSWT